MKRKLLVSAFGLLSGALYSCALPLWEGFDEPLHYGYVESLAMWHSFPVMNKTPVSREIDKSLDLTPISWLLNRGMGDCCTSFQDWHRLGQSERKQREQELRALPSMLRREPSDLLNWEAQQAPLAYLILAPLDGSLKSVSLLKRVLILRLACSTIATLLLYFAFSLLLEQLGLTNEFEFAVLACVLESEMLWASVAHVGNDWLAIPLTVFFLATLLVAASSNRSGDLLILAAVFTAGLLTKAYFLAFAPVFVGMVLYKRIQWWTNWKTTVSSLGIPILAAGPWYLRNWLVYGSVSGTQQSMAGIGLAQVAAAITRIDWIKASITFVRWSLWTGNWSFLSFSRLTLDIEALLLVAAFLTYLFWLTRITKAHLWLLAACVSFLIALLYQACAAWIHTKGASTSPEPWYAQGVIVCIWALCFLGLQASGIAGRSIAILLCLVSAWIAVVTYAGKLLPFYGGAPGKATLRNVFHWWIGNPTQDLQGVALGPVWLVYLLLIAFTAFLILVVAISVRWIARD